MSRSPLEPFVLEDGFAILDGGLATELETQGADLTGELWSAALLADNPSLVRETHLAYYRAGADVATTASYQASFEGFMRKGYDRETAIDLLLVSVKLAVEARDQFWAEHQGRPTSPASASTKPETRAPTQLALFPPDARETTTATAPEAERAQQQRGGTGDEKRHGRRRPLVAASVGCYGAALADGSEYRGEYGDTVGQQGLKGWHKERLDILARADGVDLVMFETVPCLAEVRAILSLLEELRPQVSAVISISCKDGQHLRSGERVQDFADLIWRHADGKGCAGTGEPAATPACVVGVGVNCTAPNHVAGVIRTLSEAAWHRSSSNPTSATTKISGDSATAPPGASCGDRESPPRIALVAYPNSGEEWDAGARDWVQGTGLRGVEEMGRLARDEWYLDGKGAQVFGGCCRTRPAHIAEIRRALASRDMSVDNRQTGRFVAPPEF